MKPRPTVRDIAAVVKLHFTTVARALNDDSRINPETRVRVKEAAQKLGYTPDPMLAAFSAYRQKRRTAKFQGTIAWVTNFPVRDQWHSRGADKYYAGAAQRAAEIGYRLEEFWLREPGMTAARASRILFSRGIRGLLISPLPSAHAHLSIHWNDFSAVSFGYSMVRPRINLVTPSHYLSVITCLRKLKALGHRRIGFTCLKAHDERIHRLWSSAFHSEQQSFPKALQIPPLIPAQYEKKAFLAWFERHRPGAIVTTTVEEGPLDWLRSPGLGLKVPGDVSVALLNVEAPKGKLAGIDERSESVGRAAVNLLADMLLRGERGVPAIPLQLLVDGEWVDGPTVSAAVPRKAA